MYIIIFIILCNIFVVFYFKILDMIKYSKLLREPHNVVSIPVSIDGVRLFASSGSSIVRNIDTVNNSVEIEAVSLGSFIDSENSSLKLLVKQAELLGGNGIVNVAIDIQHIPNRRTSKPVISISASGMIVELDG